MSRKKSYIEEEVVTKAMKLFWRNGFKNTSMQMLEEEMGINKFSIYSSFGSKQGVFLESLKSYEKNTEDIFTKLINATNGVSAIKEFFYDSIKVCNREGNPKGCLITNTYNEFGNNENNLVHQEMQDFMNNLKELFIQKLRMDLTKSTETVLKEADFLILAKHGLAAASRINNKKEIENYIEMTFKNI